MRWPVPRLSHYILVILLIQRDDLLAAELLRGVPAPGFTHAVVPVLIGQERSHAGRLRDDIADRFEKAVFTLGDQLGDAAHTRGDRYDSARHRLKRDEPER